ncbi:DUF1302 family protein [Ideonella sp. A 288]|uniref:DUF1302 domain-containing protein n=1 Tax=Ideonella sp. A 288 TaxID=1962181 RepID=UPI000B4B6301|nr:DUF1302 family protein [Ideonella sp. A 288]
MVPARPATHRGASIDRGRPHASRPSSPPGATGYRTPFSNAHRDAAAALVVAAGPALAADVDIAGGRLTVTGSVFAGTVIRADHRDAELIPAPNAALVGITGAGVGGKNQDDGNLNFGHGDAVSRALKGLIEFAYRRDGLGAVAQAQAWHDVALSDGGRPFGHLPNGYAAGAPLNDGGFASRSRFSGVVAGDVYAFGHAELGGRSLDWKAGLQKLDWGSRFTTPGGLGDLSPRDQNAARRAGALPEEGRIPVPAVSARVAVTPSTTVDAFVQAGFRASALPGCGTFYSANDFVAGGCDKGLLGVGSDPASIAAGTFLKRAGDVMASDSGQYGLGLRQTVDAIGAELGVYVVQFHSRVPYLAAIKSLRTGAPFVPRDPGGLNPQYFVSYPERIRVLGVTLERKLPAGTVLAELTYRPNQPYQYNTIDLLNAFASAAGPTPLRAAVTALAAGARFDAYERHKAVQLNLAVVHGLPALLGAAGGNVAAELAIKNVPDLPDPAVMRFRRSDVYGQAPVGASACPATAGAKTCALDGYVSANAVAYRLRAGLRYPGTLAGLDVTPSLSFGHDLSGWSEDGSINEGRQFAVLSLKAEYRKAFVAELAWQPTWGGAYNNTKDRSTASLCLGYRF